MYKSLRHLHITPQKKLMGFQPDIVSPLQVDHLVKVYPDQRIPATELFSHPPGHHQSYSRGLGYDISRIVKLVQDIQTSQGRCRGPGREALGVDLDDVKGQKTGLIAGVNLAAQARRIPWNVDGEGF